jgi:hypothetical protein
VTRVKQGADVADLFAKLQDLLDHAVGLLGHDPSAPARQAFKAAGDTLCTNARSLHAARKDLAVYASGPAAAIKRR